MSIVPPFSAERYFPVIQGFNPVKRTGKVYQIVGLTIEGEGPAANLGEHCLIKVAENAEPLSAEVVGFKSGRILLMPLGEMSGISPGCEIIATGQKLQVEVGTQLLGRVLDGLGRPDGRKRTTFNRTIAPSGSYAAKSAKPKKN